MALVTTSITPVISTFPYEVMAPIRYTDQPRGELIASIQSGAVAATGSGDDAQVNIAVNLPVNFSYVMTDFSVSVETDGTNTWQSEACLVYVDAEAAAQRLVRYGMRCPGSICQDGDFEAMVYQTLFSLPKFQMMPFRGGAAGSQVFMRLRNVNLQEIAATVDMTARFLIFDVAQRYTVPVNIATLTR